MEVIVGNRYASTFEPSECVEVLSVEDGDVKYRPYQRTGSGSRPCGWERRDTIEGFRFSYESMTHRPGELN